MTPEKQNETPSALDVSTGSAIRPRRSIIAIRNPWLRVPLAILAAPLALIFCGAVGLVRGLDEAGNSIHGAIRGERNL